ncbi:hypothetical protein XENOCAPTIV_011134, partial [Xenoophorus captivus]
RLHHMTDLFLCWGQNKGCFMPLNPEPEPLSVQDQISKVSFCRLLTERVKLKMEELHSMSRSEWTRTGTRVSHPLIRFTDDSLFISRSMSVHSRKTLTEGFLRCVQVTMQ